MNIMFAPCLLFFLILAVHAENHETPGVIEIEQCHWPGDLQRGMWWARRMLVKTAQRLQSLQNWMKQTSLPSLETQDENVNTVFKTYGAFFNNEINELVSSTSRRNAAQKANLRRRLYAEVARLRNTAVAIHNNIPEYPRPYVSYAQNLRDGTETFKPARTLRDDDRTLISCGNPDFERDTPGDPGTLPENAEYGVTDLRPMGLSYTKIWLNPRFVPFWITNMDHVPGEFEDFEADDFLPFPMNTPLTASLEDEQRERSRPVSIGEFEPTLPAILIKMFSMTNTMLLDKYDTWTQPVEYPTPLNSDNRCTYTPQPGTSPVEHAQQRGKSLWRCVRWLARDHPDIATRSEINFQFFVLAMFMSRVDWSSGFAAAPKKSLVSEAPLPPVPYLQPPSGKSGHENRPGVHEDPTQPGGDDLFQVPTYNGVGKLPLPVFWHPHQEYDLANPGSPPPVRPPSAQPKDPPRQAGPRKAIYLSDILESESDEPDDMDIDDPQGVSPVTPHPAGTRSGTGGRLPPNALDLPDQDISQHKRPLPKPVSRPAKDTKGKPAPGGSGVQSGRVTKPPSDKNSQR